MNTLRMKSSQIKQVFYHPTKKYYVTDRSLWPEEPDRSHFPDLSAGGRRRRERGARVTGLRSEAGECYSSWPRWTAGVYGGVSIRSGSFVLINYLSLKGRVIQRVLLVKCIKICFSIMRIIDRKGHIIYINAIKCGN